MDLRFLPVHLERERGGEGGMKKRGGEGGQPHTRRSHILHRRITEREGGEDGREGGREERRDGREGRREEGEGGRKGRKGGREGEGGREREGERGREGHTRIMVKFETAGGCEVIGGRLVLSEIYPLQGIRAPFLKEEEGEKHA